jgi:hypothetical protein
MEDWRQHGAKALERLRETNVGTYCKLMVMLVPRDIRVEHHNPVGDLSNEQLDLMIATLTERLEAKANEAKVIDGQAIELESLTAPAVENPDDELLAPRPKPKREPRRKRIKKLKLRPRVTDDGPPRRGTCLDRCDRRGHSAA